MNKNSHLYLLGCVYTIIGGICYALGGTCGQYLFIHNHMEADWLVPIRTLSSGIILLSLDVIFYKQKIFRAFSNWKDSLNLFLFGMFATAFSQLGFYTSIQYSNAAVSTVLVYLYAVFILIYEVITQKRLPMIAEIISVSLVILGTFFIATHGDFSKWEMSPKAILWSLIGSFAYAVYTLQPSGLLRKYSLFSIIGWGLVIGGSFLTVIMKPWQYQDIIYNSDLLLYMIGVSVVGTVLSFTFYLAGVKIVGGVVASVLSAVDPIVATLVCVYALNIGLVWQDYLGMFIVLFAIIVMSLAKKNQKIE